MALNAQKNTISHWQFEVLAGDNYTGITGLIDTDFLIQITKNAVDVTGSWTLTDGTGVLDEDILADTIYLDEIGDGRYRVRWIPDAAALWQLRLKYVVGTSIHEEFFETTVNTIDQPGLVYSFIPPGT